MNINANYEKYTKYLRAYITRDGVEALINYLDHSDIKVAPASTKYHMSVEGGLVQHSLNVFMRMIQLVNTEYDGFDNCPYTKETIALVSLLHDISKVNFYKQYFKNVKNDETGAWEKVQAYTIRDDNDRLLFASHEENSLYMLSKFFSLTYDEELALRYHMGHTDSSNENDVYSAYKRSTLALLLFVADMEATCIDEVVNTKDVCDASNEQQTATNEPVEQEQVEVETAVEEDTEVDSADNDALSDDSDASIDADAPGSSVFEDDDIPF